MSEHRNGNGWLTVGAVAGLIASLLTPMYFMISANTVQAEKALHWIDDYSRGLVPSSAEKAIAAIEKMFAEVETQFRAFRDRMLENEDHTNQAVVRAEGSILENRHEIENLRERVARIEQHVADGDVCRH